MGDSIQLRDVQARPGPLDDAAQMWALRVWANDDSRSLLRLAPDAVQRAMLSIPEEYRNMYEGDIRLKFNPTPLDNQLRLSFWNEFSRIQEGMHSKMLTAMIIRGVISEEYFYKKYLKDPIRVAWLITPPQDYTVRLKEGLDFGLSQLRSILDADHWEIDAKGRKKVNTKLLELKLKVTAMFDLRLNGAVAQKLQVENKNMNMNISGTAKEIQSMVEGRNMADLDRRLEILRKKELMMDKGVHPSASEPSVLTVEAEVIPPIPEAKDDPRAEES